MPNPEPRRFAVVVAPSEVYNAQVVPYLPSNYESSPLRDGTIIISGHDSAGWTLDGYVIPRLASGMIFAVELKPEGVF